MMCNSAYPRTGKRGAPQAFARKLFQILESAEKEGGSIAWNEAGNAFFVKDIDTFSNDILMKYFRHCKFQSFQRQLNLYGFRKITRGPDAGSYAHQYFLKGREDLLVLVRRSHPSTPPPHILAAAAGGDVGGVSPHQLFSSFPTHQQVIAAQQQSMTPLGVNVPLPFSNIDPALLAQLVQPKTAASGSLPQQTHHQPHQVLSGHQLLDNLSLHVPARKIHSSPVPGQQRLAGQVQHNLSTVQVPQQAQLNHTETNVIRDLLAYARTNGNAGASYANEASQLMEETFPTSRVLVENPTSFLDPPVLHTSAGLPSVETLLADQQQQQLLQSRLREQQQQQAGGGVMQQALHPAALHSTPPPPAAHPAPLAAAATHPHHHPMHLTLQQLRDLGSQQHQQQPAAAAAHHQWAPLPAAHHHGMAGLAAAAEDCLPTAPRPHAMVAPTATVGDMF